MAKEYKTTAHAIYDIQYHLVGCAKYRYPVLRGHIGERCRDLLRQIAMAREIAVIRGALAPDHPDLRLVLMGGPSEMSNEDRAFLDSAPKPL